MVPLANGKVTAHQRNDPRKEIGEEGIAHRRVHPKAREALEEEGEERYEVGETSERIMSDRVDRFALGLENIHFEDLHDLLELFFSVQDEILPLGVFITYKAPIDPVYEIEKEQESGQKMNKADGSEPIAEGSLRAALYGQRAAYEIPGDGKNRYAGAVEPMVEAHGDLPYIHPV